MTSYTRCGSRFRFFIDEIAKDHLMMNGITVPIVAVRAVAMPHAWYWKKKGVSQLPDLISLLYFL